MKAIFFAVIFLGCTMVGCRKFVTVSPPVDQIVNPEPFSSDASATATIIGIYSEMMNSTAQFSSANMTLYAGMYADELYYYTPGTKDEFVASHITEANHGILNSAFWVPAYKYIYAANLALEQLRLSNRLSGDVKQRLEGEALFTRAFCYHYLVNLFGDVPLVIGSDYKVNQYMARTPVNELYKRMTADLDSAIGLLPPGYPEGTRTRPNKWAAKALRARIALYAKDYATAVSLSSELIGNNLFALNSDLNGVFLKDSKEAIWQLQPVHTNYNTTEGNIILPASNSTQPNYLVTNFLLNAFEDGDGRRAAWIKQRLYAGATLFYPFKYKVRTSDVMSEYYMVFRLAEQYLIRSEANAQLGHNDAAVADLNVIRKRAGLGEIFPTGLSSLVASIEHERQTELCFEWGHRWFDLQRNNRASAVLGSIKPLWSDAAGLWPVPINQINLNPSLTQNKGY